MASNEDKSSYVMKEDCDDEEEEEEKRVVEYGGVDKSHVLEDNEHSEIISFGELNFIMDFLRNTDLKVPHSFSFFPFFVLALFVSLTCLAIVYFVILHCR